jgi:glucose/arabinose dehydrogenase
VRAPSLAVATVVLLAACGAGPASPPVATTAPSASPATSEPSQPPPATTAPSASAAGTQPVEDAALLDVLPQAVDGVPVAIESIAFQEALADPGFSAAVEAAAFAVVVDASDLASAVVAKPHTGTFSDAWYADWRATYDRGACSQAGGLAATTETELGNGRILYVGTCSGGLHTYHTWLPGRGVVISAFGLGDRRFGEQLMAGIRP